MTPAELREAIRAEIDRIISTAPRQEIDAATDAALRVVREAMREPTTEALVAIAHPRPGEDGPVGKTLQDARPGLVPPRAEYEWAVGQYKRVLAASALREE